MNRTFQIAGGVVLLLGLILLPISYTRDREVRSASDWKEASGRVVRSQIRSDSGGPYGFIEYEYTVDGKLYRSNRVRFDSIRSTIDTSRYPESSTVQVFYNPANPGEAVLDRGRHSPLRKGGIIAILLGTGLLLTPLVVDKLIRRSDRGVRRREGGRGRGRDG